MGDIWSIGLVRKRKREKVSESVRNLGSDSETGTAHTCAKINWTIMTG